MRRIIIIFSLLLVSACDHIEEDKQVVAAQAKQDAKDIETNVTRNTARVANNVRDAAKRTASKAREWWITPLPSNEKKPVPPSYCYKVMQDILCYRQPMPGWENKLVGYQGTDAPPPAPSVIRALPQIAADSRNLPASRASNAKPVFVGMPADVKETKKSDEAVTIDSSHEPLPDPALAPQL